MRIVVFVAPASESSSVPGRCDREALALAAAMPGAEVVAIAAGPETVRPVLQAALAAGARRALRVSCEVLGTMDFHGRGEMLAAAARHLGADLVLCGALGDDEGLGAVPASLARHMGATQVAAIDELSPAPEPGHVLCTVRCGGRKRRLRVRLPALLTVLRARPLAEPEPPTPVPRADGTVEILTLGELGLNEARLRRRDDLLGTREEPARDHLVVRSIPELLALLPE